MTEEEWLRAKDVYSLADFLRTQHRANRTKAGRRKLRLFGCACCRQVWSLFASEPECAALVQAAEQFSDGESSPRLLAKLIAALPDVQSNGLGFHLFAVHAARFVADSNVFISAVAVAQIVDEGARHVASDSGIPTPSGDQQSAILRDIFGNPFRPVRFSPQWRTTDAVALAKQMYASREFDAMPILADALQDAGCDNEDILAHCRDSNAAHVRGCWGVDLVLDKQ